ncbi:MAG TPA: N-acetyl sugar amidotransferase [Candidatus Andersenbacteria bacterium]|nr:N-acetyl sugar amidotransferase [Candidatus Andersenbacteria bacterium]
MTYCQRCVLPDTRPGLALDDEGVCNACRSAERKQHEVDWQERDQEFTKLASEVKKMDRSYDCIIPVSGGKDSHWQVVTCLEHGLHPLAVTWCPPHRTEIGRANLENLKNLGVDHIDFSINAGVQKRFMRRSFEKLGTPFVPMHLAMDAIARVAARAYRTPLIVWGENSADEYGTGDASLSGAQLKEAWMQTFNTRGTTASDWLAEGFTREELAPYFAPETDSGEKTQPIFLGYYFRWDPEHSRQVAAQHGFRSRSEGALTGYYAFADLDDALLAVHHWLKWYKFGITRTFDNLSLEIRNERMTRDEAIAIIRQRGEEVPREAIQHFCEYVGLTVPRFYETAEAFRNHDIWKRVDGHWQLASFLIEDWGWQESVLERAT